MDRYTCEETFRRLDDYLDRHLTVEEIQLVEEHLEICVGCAAEFEFEANTLIHVRAKLQRIALPPNLMARISQAIREN